MRHPRLSPLLALGILAGVLGAPPAVANAAQQEPPRPEPPRSDAAEQRAQEQRQRSGDRRSRRVRMERVALTSPDGRVELEVLPNAERLTVAARMDGRSVLEPSPVQMSVDGFDLGAGLIWGRLETYEVDESFQWHGAHATARARGRGARLFLTSDRGQIPFTFELRVFDDGIAYRHVVPGDEGAVRVPDERSAFVLPGNATVWVHDLEMHYESAYDERRVADVQPGQWAAPPLTFELEGGRGYGSITEANLVGYSGMALEADGRRGFVVGLGHRQPVNWPFELRYGREEAKRLGSAAAVTGTITTPWRVVLLARDLDALVNSDVVPSLCPPADPRLFPEGMDTPWVAPGLAVWRYVDGGDGSFEGLLALSEFVESFVVK
jgi:alpha-glucosidase